MSSKLRFEDQEVAGSGNNFIGVAGENLTNRQLVRIGANYRLYRADASAAGTLPAMAITLAAASTGQNVLCLVKGFVGLSTWTWTAGSRLYTSDTAGVIVATAGTVTQEIGVAYSATQIWFDPQGLDTASGATNIDLRPMFFPAANPNGYTGTHTGERMIDGQDVICRLEFLLPTSYTSSWRVDVLVIPEGTGNLRRAVATNFGAVCANEGKATHTDSIAAGVVAVTNNEIECITIDAALTGAAALDLVGLEFTRSASNAADTVNADVYFIGVIIREPV